MRILPLALLRKNQYNVAGRNIKQLFAGEAAEREWRDQHEKIYSGICMVILAGALTACGAGTQESSPAESIETEAAETASSEAAEEEIAEETSSAAEEASSTAEEASNAEEASSAEETPNAEETGYVSGTLTSLGTETLGLTLEDGTEMEFSMESTVLDTEGGSD